MHKRIMSFKAKKKKYKTFLDKDPALFQFFKPLTNRFPNKNSTRLRLESENGSLKGVKFWNSMENKLTNMSMLVKNDPKGKNFGTDEILLLPLPFSNW